MSAGRFGASVAHSTQIKVGLTKLRAVVCEVDGGSVYDLYDSADENASGNDVIVSGDVAPASGTELQFKGLTFKKGLYISIAEQLGQPVALTVIYE